MELKQFKARIGIGLLLLAILANACTPGPGPIQTSAPPSTPCTGSNCSGTSQPTETILPSGQPTAFPATTQAPAPSEPASNPAPTLANSSPTSSVASPAPSQANPSPTAPACEGSGCQTGTPPATVRIPDFSHVIVLIFENHEYGLVAGNTREMPNFNRLAGQYTLLTQYYAITHPSLPNYIALLAGDTHGITTDCQDCFVDATNLPDLIESAKRTWKTYQEDMPSPCFVGSGETYAQRHNPFIYFNDIRTNPARCQADVVPLTQLDADLAGPGLPNFSFISPNLCNSAHDCGLDVADKWLGNMVTKLTTAKSFDDHSLIVVTFDEGQGNHSCCGLGPSAGGQVATLLISPLVKSGFQDATPYTHYSLIKTLAAAWGMPELGHAADPQTNRMAAPWK
jgi:phosphatidylinositol-3-phosphatase